VELRRQPHAHRARGAGSTLDAFNIMRSLERVVAEMNEPSRSGFEQLQRPLSFRKVVR
jgi:hypothetical protein